MTLTLIVGTLLLLILFLPVDLIRSKTLPGEPDARADERDVMFARLARVEGTPEYEDYYSRRPELKQTDDRIRAMTPLFEPGSRYYDPVISLEAEKYFRDIYEIKPNIELVETWKKKLEEGADRSLVVKGMVEALGAVAVGFTRLGPGYIYSHKGRFADDYGKEIELDHPSVIVFLVEMDFDEMQRAPGVEVLRESARQYWVAAVISMTIVEVLKGAGFSARAHYDAHYDLILPPLAVEAGLGEMGRNNILIAGRFGSRVRIGAVSTDIDLEQSQPIHLAADEFCTICMKCALNCPSRALSVGEKEEVRGVEKWPTDAEKCYAFWRQTGSDCGICMAVCPYSHQNNLFHNSVRSVIRLNPWIRYIALWFDNLIYGRKWKPQGDRA